MDRRFSDDIPKAVGREQGDHPLGEVKKKTPTRGHHHPRQLEEDCTARGFDAGHSNLRVISAIIPHTYQVHFSFSILLWAPSLWAPPLVFSMKL